MLCAAILKMHPFAADAPSAAEIDRQVSAATGYISLYILVVSPVMVRRSNPNAHSDASNHART